MFSADHSNNFGLDFLNGPAVDLDGGDDRQEGLNRHAEDYVLVTPASDSWGLNGMGHDHSHPSSGFEVPMADWMTGPAGLSASGVLKGAGPGAISAPSDTMVGMSKGPGVDGNAGEDTGNGEAKPEGNGTDGTGINGSSNGGMEWMGSEGGLNALSPVSLSGLVQSVEKAAGVAEAGSVPNGTGRNHELDFFSF